MTVGATGARYPGKAAGVCFARCSGRDGSRPAASSGTLAGRLPLSDSVFATAGWRCGVGILTPIQYVCVRERNKLSITRLTACCALSRLGCWVPRVPQTPSTDLVSVLCVTAECHGCNAGACAAGGRRAAAGYAPGRRHARGRVPAAPAAVQVAACAHISARVWQGGITHGNTMFCDVVRVNSVFSDPSFHCSCKLPYCRDMLQS